MNTPVIGCNWDHNQVGTLLKVLVNQDMPKGERFDQWSEYQLMEDYRCKPTQYQGLPRRKGTEMTWERFEPNAYALPYYKKAGASLIPPYDCTGDWVLLHNGKTYHVCKSGEQPVDEVFKAATMLMESMK